MKPTDAKKPAKASEDKKIYGEFCKLPPIYAATNALTERIKELNCLYSISSLLENQDVNLDWILSRAVELIPAALQYPELACSCR